MTLRLHKPSKNIKCLKKYISIIQPNLRLPQQISLINKQIILFSKIVMENSSRAYFTNVSEDIQYRINKLKERIDQRYPGFRSTPLSQSRSLPPLNFIIPSKPQTSQTELQSSQSSTRPLLPQAVEASLKLVSSDADKQQAHLVSDLQAIRRKLFRPHKSVKSISTGVLSPSSQHAKQFVFPETDAPRKALIPALKIKTRRNEEQPSCRDLPTVVSRDESSLSDSQNSGRKKKPGIHSLKSELDMLSGGSQSRKEISSPSSAISMDLITPRNAKFSARSLQSLEEQDDQVSLEGFNLHQGVVTTGEYVQNFVSEKLSKVEKMTKRSRKQITQFSYKQEFSDDIYRKILQRIQERTKKMQESCKDQRRPASDRNILSNFDVQTKIRDGLMDKITKLQTMRELD